MTLKFRTSVCLSVCLSVWKKTLDKELNVINLTWSEAIETVKSGAAVLHDVLSEC